MAGACTRRRGAGAPAAILLFASLLLVLEAALAAGTPTLAPSQNATALPAVPPPAGPLQVGGDKAPNHRGSLLWNAKQPGSDYAPLLSPAHPLHRAILLWDLAGVKAAVEGRKAGVNDVAMTLHNPPQRFPPMRAALMVTHSQNDTYYHGPNADSNYHPDTLQRITMYLVAKEGTYMSDKMLVLAALVGDVALVHALLRAGATPTIRIAEMDRFRDGMTISCDYNHPQYDPDTVTAGIVQALQAYGAPPEANAFACSAPACPKTCAASRAGLATPELAKAIKAGAVPPALASNATFAQAWASALRAGE